MEKKAGYAQNLEYFNRNILIRIKISFKHFPKKICRKYLTVYYVIQNKNIKYKRRGLK